MYLDHTFARKTFAHRNHFTFWLMLVLRPNFRSANWLSESHKVKSPSVDARLLRLDKPVSQSTTVTEKNLETQEKYHS